MNEEKRDFRCYCLYSCDCITAEEDQEDIPDLSSLSAPMAKRPCQCCCQTYSEILSFLEKRSEAEQRLREDEFALRREEIEVQKSKTFRNNPMFTAEISK